MKDQERKAQALLEAELLKLAEKYIDIYPEYEQQEHCPADGCTVNWMVMPKKAKYCHLHGEKLVRGMTRLTKAQVLNEVSYIARYARDKEEGIESDE